MTEQTALDRWDVLASLGSGALCAAVDALWVKDISLREGRAWGIDQAQSFVLKTAKRTGFKGETIAGAIEHLEKDHPIPADKLTKDFGSGKQHHLRDMVHHPTPVGLLFSIMMQFTGKGYGTDTSGAFISVPIEGWKQTDLLTSIYTGTITWAMHLISDMAGSSGTVAQGKEGTGIPGPILSFLKELSALPGVRAIMGKDQKGNGRFSVVCSKLFNGTLLGDHDADGHIMKGRELPFDLRTELGIAHEAVKNGQYIPVLLCEGIVCAFYSVRRLLREIGARGITTIEAIGQLTFRDFLPRSCPVLTHMRTMSAAAFSAIDITTAGIKSWSKHREDKSAFLVDLIQGVNVFGILRLGGTVGKEGIHGAEKLYDMFTQLVAQHPEALALAKEFAQEAGDVVATASTIAAVGTPVGFVSAAIGVYTEVKETVKDLHLSEQERRRVEDVTRQHIRVLEAERVQMESLVSAYMTTRLRLIQTAFDQMDDALAAGDTDGFIAGNTALQKGLGKESSFTDQDGFDALMGSDDAFRL